MADDDFYPGWHETEKELDGALCNFCNGARDPYPPASEWDAETWSNLGQLSKAYNDWYSWKRGNQPARPTPAAEGG